MDLRQEDVAARIGAEIDTIRNWENRRTEPDLRFMPAVISFLGYNPLPEAKTRGERVRSARLSLGWSRRESAGRAGVDEATVHRVEADTNGIARWSLLQVWAALGPSEH